MKIIPAKKTAAGFPTDMNMLLERFVATNTVRYEGFARLWREAKFPLIFCGRKDPREMRLFVDELFYIILQLWVATSSFQEKVFGLYMLYGVYTMQPVTPKVKVRIKMAHWALSEELLQQSTKEQHFDICYITHRMRLQHSFHYVAFLKLRSPALIAEKDEDKNSISEMCMKVYSNLHDMTQGGLLEQLSLIHDQYTSVRSMQDVPSVSQLDMVKENIFEELSKEVSKLQALYKVRFDQEKDGAAINPSDDSDGDSDTSDVGARRKRIRQKQFASTSQTRKGRRFQELVIDEDAGSSDEVANKKTPKPTKKGAPSKAPPIPSNKDVERSTAKPSGPQKGGRSAGRRSKSKKVTAASGENVGDAAGSSTSNANAEVTPSEGETVQDKPKSSETKKRSRGRPKKSAEPSRSEAYNSTGQTGESTGTPPAKSKKKGRRSEPGVQPKAKRARKS